MGKGTICIYFQVTFLCSSRRCLAAPALISSECFQRVFDGERATQTRLQTGNVKGVNQPIFVGLLANFGVKRR